jgi:hypothetical protein
MKHFGAKMEYADERVRDLMKAYDNYIANCSHIEMQTVYQTVVNMPAPRFYVSEKRASIVVSELLKGHPCRNKLKNEMFTEICRRVMELKKSNPTLGITELCAIVVQQPAPKFYMAAASAKMLIIRTRKKWIKEKLKRLYLYASL